MAENGFKHKGRTFGKDDIFFAHEARSETYHAFGRQKDFLTKLVGLGFLVQDGLVYHPAYWTPIDKGKGDGYHTHRYVTSTGTVRLGRARPHFSNKK